MPILFFLTLLISSFSQPLLYSHTMAATPSYASPGYQPLELDVSVVKEALAVDEPERHQSDIIQHIFENLYDTSQHQLVRDLTHSLTIDELQKLYQILIRAVDERWTEEFAERIWQGRLFKIQSEPTTLYNHPRIYLIAVVPGERRFSIMLNDGSVWDVAEHLSGDPRLDLIIIKPLLGQYVAVEEMNGDEGYAYRLTNLGFPEIQFHGYLLANKAPSLVSEGKTIYWLTD